MACIIVVDVAFVAAVDCGLDRLINLIVLALGMHAVRMRDSANKN